MVKDLDEEVDGFEQRQLVVGGVAGEGEVEPRVAAVDDLEGFVLIFFFRGGGERENEEQVL